MANKTVLSLGQCAADQWVISRFLQTRFGADIVPADRFSDAEARLRQGGIDLLLVNRVLDRDGSSGLDFIRQIKADETLRLVPVMLVSNYADAQSQAVTLGALPGLGKAALEESETLMKLNNALNGPE